MIWDCLENKKFITEKPKEDNKTDKQKPRPQGKVFAMTHYDAQATFDMVTRTIRIHTLFAKAPIDPRLTHYFAFVSFVRLLGMSITSTNFDFFIATPMGDYFVTNRMLRDCLVTIGYK